MKPEVESAASYVLCSASAPAIRIRLDGWQRAQDNAHMTLLTHSRFSARFDLTTPIALAPMALASGGALAAACARAGALGMVGG